MRKLLLPPIFRPGTRPVASLVLLVLCAALLTTGAVFFVWQRYQYVRLGFDVSALRRERTALEQAIEPLEIEAEYLSRLERIEALARGKLGMRPPRASQVKLLDTHESPELPSQ